MTAWRKSKRRKNGGKQLSPTSNGVSCIKMIKTMKKIIFGESLDIRDGLQLVRTGVVVILKRILRMIDRVIRARPYLFMLIEFAVMLLMCLAYIGQARAERDTASKRYVEAQAKADSLSVASEMWHNMARRK